MANSERGEMYVMPKGSLERDPTKLWELATTLKAKIAMLEPELDFGVMTIQVADSYKTTEVFIKWDVYIKIAAVHEGK